MAAAVCCSAECLQLTPGLGYRQSSSLFCSTSRTFATLLPDFHLISKGRCHSNVGSHICASRNTVEPTVSGLGLLPGRGTEEKANRWSKAQRSLPRRRMSVRARARSKGKVEEPSDDDVDKPLDTEVVDVGDDPFNDGGLEFEDLPVKAAKKTMEEKLASQTRRKKIQTVTKEFTDRKGKKVFLEVPVQDKSPEELEARAWWDRREMDEEADNPPNFDSQYMDPFNFRTLLPEAKFDNDEFDFGKFVDVLEKDDEVSHADIRDDSADPNEEWYAKDWTGPVTVAQLTHTRFMCPSAWEGKLDDGRDVYIKHRYGILSVGILHRNGWRKRWNTVYYILHKHSLNSQCSTVRMRELLEGKIVNFTCKIQFADGFDNIYDCYEGYEVERKQLETPRANAHPHWDLAVDFPKQDKLEVLEKTKELAFEKLAKERRSVDEQPAP